MALAAEMEAKVQAALGETPYEPSSLHVLSGGTGNFVYRAVLKTPLKDGTTEVLVKHGEDYVASNPDFKLTLLRCKIEEACLRGLSTLSSPPSTKPPGEWDFVVKTPAFYYFDAPTNTQVQELFPGAKDLKTYALERFTGADNVREQCIQLGESLGRWLKAFHTMTTASGGEALRDLVQRDGAETRALKQYINFGWLVERVAEYPDILGASGDVFRKVADMAKCEAEGEGRVLIHGDFWTGNILIPDAPIAQNGTTPVCVVDWELAQVGVPALDLGQLVAELYMLYIARGVKGGMDMIEGFVGGYGLGSSKSGGDKNGEEEKKRSLAQRTVVQTGVHLVSFGSMVARSGGWGPEAMATEVVERVVRRGAELVRMGFYGDTERMGGDEVARLLI